MASSLCPRVSRFERRERARSSFWKNDGSEGRRENRGARRSGELVFSNRCGTCEAVSLRLTSNGRNAAAGVIEGPGKQIQFHKTKHVAVAMEKKISGHQGPLMVPRSKQIAALTVSILYMLSYQTSCFPWEQNSDHNEGANWIFTVKHCSLSFMVSAEYLIEETLFYRIDYCSLNDHYSYYLVLLFMVIVKADKKLLTVLFPDGRDGRTFTLKAETLEELNEWKTALENALALAPSAVHVMGQNGIFHNEVAESSEALDEQSNFVESTGKDKPLNTPLVVGTPVLLALESIDGSPSFLEKALRFIEDHGKFSVEAS
ncbi:hypothetical protein AXF42_Ash002735 [Apostasia shenzhenica]|uniref:PH domain-containing protein n=1 Tax=Apostasia shenzhenica TaxID=1088818 RepID=A0A2I0A748_9ASPA|nr:hypothetical protein AXF42_Ash002735 [Apostasia shenzhenica]